MQQVLLMTLERYRYLLMPACMDEVRYETARTGNLLTMIKRKG